MNAQNLPDAVKNQSLFSNYYLDSLIIEQPQWTDTPNIESDYEAIKQRFDAIAPNTERFNEAQTEREFIQPVLEQLGHIFEVQPSLQALQGTRVPDYAFFASREALNAAQPHINTNQFFTTPADERDRQLEKAKTLYQRCLDRGSTDCVLGFVKHHLTADPERSEIVHDLLACLAEEMVEMNKAKGEEIRGFLGWLERAIEIKIDGLKNKTKIQSYFDLSFNELCKILKQNRRSIVPDPSSRDFQELLEREFTSSRNKLDPLLIRIQSTDALIDQVVYQLYGLTDEEIAIVEGDVSQS